MTNYFNKLKFIDIHYHANPDMYKRRYSAIETGRKYKDVNGAVVLKSHLGSTSIQATIAQQEGLPVFPSIVLNNISGGIDYKMVIRALAEYQPVIPSKLIVHLPTITGRRHQSKLSREINYPELSSHLCLSETIYDGNNKIKTEVIDLLKFANDYPIVISSGHASKEELFDLIDACITWSVPSLLLNQPANPLTGLQAPDLEDITKHPFIWVEQTALTYLLEYQSENDFKAVLKDIPNVIYSSDLGQYSQMDVTDWLLVSEQWFSKFQLSPNRKAELCLINPSQLLLI